MYQFESFRMTDGMINKVIASRVVKVAKANKPLKTILRQLLLMCCPKMNIKSNFGIRPKKTSHRCRNVIAETLLVSAGSRFRS